MALRIRRGSREREALLRRAVDASNAERRRIAGDLHDGIVQDLAGLSYSLAASAERVQSNDGDPEAAATLRNGAERTRQNVRELRSLLVEIHPPRLREAGLAAAVSDLLSPLAARGIETSAEIPEDLELAPESEALFFRVAQEAVRNAASHADPSRVDVRVSQSAQRVALEVLDDGCGFDVDHTFSATGEGHLGLELVSELAEDAGAEITIDSARGDGTRVRMELGRS